MSDIIKKIDFNKEEMCRFIKEFNPTLQKYLIDETSEYYDKALRYDDLNKSVNLKKNSVPHLVMNAELIYGNARQSIDYGQIYKDVLDKFLLNFVSIPDLGSLFDAQYMDFEWNMHSDINFNEHRNSYYRDHFIHQVRNLFMTFKLIENDYIFNSIKQALTNSTRSKVTQYFKNRSNVWVSELENNKNFHNLLLGIFKNKPEYANCDCDVFLKDYFCGYVIRGALIISSLFHDIGYPVAHYLSVKERMINFIPAVYSIMGVNNFDFNYIYSLLSESVLFKFVGKEVIYKRFLKNDHGTISALLLGVFFYKTGLIHSLSIEKQTAVELGMLAIYNHTLALKKVNPKDKTTFTEIVFALNPISYLLRWCDDMQEWDREYFEIASVSNLLFCSDCKMPLRKAVIQPTEFFSVNGIEFDKNLEKDLNRDPSFSRKFFSYSCMCKDLKKHYRFTKRDDFNRRMLLQIKACDNLSVIFNDTRNFISIDFQYNPYKLLRLANIHPSFIKKRQNEISRIKKFVSCQQFSNGKTGYKFISIKHILSPNPIYLKMLIIKDFFEELRNYVDNGRSKLLSRRLSSIHKRHMELLKLLFDNNYKLSEYIGAIDHLADNLIVLSYGKNFKSKKYYNVLLENCKKYIAMMLYQEIVICKKSKPEDSVRQEFKNYIGTYSKNDTRELLVNAALDKIESYIAPEDVQYHINTENYVKDTDSKDFLFTVTRDYCDSLNEINQFSLIENEMTYYTDLYMYESLNYQTELLRRQSKLYNRSLSK